VVSAAERGRISHFCISWELGALDTQGGIGQSRKALFAKLFATLHATPERPFIDTPQRRADLLKDIAFGVQNLQICIQGIRGHVGKVYGCRGNVRFCIDILMNGRHNVINLSADSFTQLHQGFLEAIQFLFSHKIHSFLELQLVTL
jgi:hypothetical protein